MPRIELLITTFILIFLSINSAYADKYVVQENDSLEKVLNRFNMLNEDGSNKQEVLKKLKKLNPKLKNINLLQEDVVIDLGNNITVPENLKPQEIIEFDELEQLKYRAEKTAEELRKEKLRKAARLRKAKLQKAAKLRDEKLRLEAEQRRNLFDMKRRDLLRKNIFLVGKGDHLWKIIKQYKPEWYSEDVNQQKVIYARIKALNPKITKLSELSVGMQLRLGKESDIKETKTYIVKRGDKFWDIITKQMPLWPVKSLGQRRKIYNDVKVLNPLVQKFSNLMPGTKLVLEVEAKRLRDEDNLYTVKRDNEAFWDIVKYKRPYEMLGSKESRSRYYNRIRDLNPKHKQLAKLKEGDELRFDRFVSAHHRTSFIRGGTGITAFNITQSGAFGDATGSVVFANRLNIMNHLEKKSWTFDLELDKFAFSLNGYDELLETSSFQFLIGYKPFSRLSLWGGQTNFLLGMDSNTTPVLKLTSLGLSHTYINTKYVVLGIRWESCDWFLPGKLLKSFPNYYKAHQKDWKDYKLKKDENVLGYGARQLSENVSWFTSFIKTFHQRAFVGLKLGIGGGIEESAVVVKEQSAMAFQLEYSLHRKLYDAKNLEVSIEFLAKYNYRSFSLNAEWGLEKGVTEIQSHDMNGMINLNIHYDFLGDFIDKVQNGLMNGIKKGFRSGYKVIKNINPLMDSK